MRRALVIVALLARVAAAQRAHAPSRAELAARLLVLERELGEAREELQRGDRPEGAATEARLAALERALAQLTPERPDLDARLGELSEALAELRQDAATKRDLGKIVRKPDEHEYRSRNARELEVRGAWTDLREVEIREIVDGLSLLETDPTLPARSKAILAAVRSLGGLLLANDARARPRMLLRLTWEANRFLDSASYLFVAATPELQLFVYDHDLDRALTARDLAAPRDRLGVILKRAAAGIALGRLRIEVGVLQFTYGSGFFVNPTNPFTPKDPLDPRREVDGVPAARVDLALLQQESMTVTAQLAAVASPVRNDLLGDHAALGLGGLATLRADTHLASLTALALYRRPDDLGREGPALGGILSANPLGLTASVEALFTESPDGGAYRPELVTSIQGFTSAIGANGTDYIVEYIYDGHLPTTDAEAAADLVRAIERGQAFLVFERLIRPLGRRQYVTGYVEPSLTPKLRASFAALVGLDDGAGALLRAGCDYELHNVRIHAFGGTLVGAEGSELRHHPIRSFAELAVVASF